MALGCVPLDIPFRTFPFQYHQDEEGYHGYQENGGVKVGSLQKVIRDEYKENQYDQE